VDPSPNGPVLVVDNYDSFTWNLVHCLEDLTGAPPVVVRNDAMVAAEAARFGLIVLSPGPGLPAEAGQLVPLIRALAPTHPMLGICLGMQAMAEAFGGTLKNLATVHHGVVREVVVEDPGDPLFNGLPRRFPAGRYHSWVVDRTALPQDFRVIAADDAGEPMAIRHRRYRLCGVQFHPESVMTPAGKALLHNWLVSCSTAVHA